MTEKQLTKREQAFVREYLCDLNGTQAAIRAGYSKRTARIIASQNLTKLNIRTEIQALTAARFERLKLDADGLLVRAATILMADARKLTSLHIGACRYCWGIGHEYQWRRPEARSHGPVSGAGGIGPQVDGQRQGQRRYGQFSRFAACWAASCLVRLHRPARGAQFCHRGVDVTFHPIIAPAE